MKCPQCGIERDGPRQQVGAVVPRELARQLAHEAAAAGVPVGQLMEAKLRRKLPRGALCTLCTRRTRRNQRAGGQPPPTES